MRIIRIFFAETIQGVAPIEPMIPGELEARPGAIGLGLQSAFPGTTAVREWNVHDDADCGVPIGPDRRVETPPNASKQVPGARLGKDSSHLLSMRSF